MTRPLKLIPSAITGGNPIFDETVVCRLTAADTPTIAGDLLGEYFAARMTTQGVTDVFGRAEITVNFGRAGSLLHDNNSFSKITRVIAIPKRNTPFLSLSDWYLAAVQITVLILTVN